MSRVVLVLALGGAGCNIAFQLDEIAPDAPRVIGPGADACTPGTFDDGTTLTSPVGGNDPFLGPTLLELFFVTGSSGGYDLAVATRTTTTGDFGFSDPLRAVNAQQEDSDPSVTADDLRLVFRSTRTGDPRTYEAVRTAPGGVFQSPVIPKGLEDVENEGDNISSDGLTVYITANNEMRQFSRASLTGGFAEAAVSPVGTGMGYPSVSPSELEVFFDDTDNGGIGRMVRASRDAPFGMREVFDQNGSDASVAADNNTLIETQGSEFLVRTRSCQ